MFLPKHLKSYEVPLDIKDCVLSGRQLEDVVPDVVLVYITLEYIVVKSK